MDSRWGPLAILQPDQGLVPLAPTRTLDKGLEAWDHLIVGVQRAPGASASSLSVSVDHHKHPLTSTLCHPGA
ncbi:hypothetical protein PoB_000809300 [Plakobranchus ocellatus]|uniref:Uncharacterized protein n=1 Tax=Plakobranchus ocellatus TaxID=259542 RepID=A0AAV3YGD9_9GAST|nr:hypothetical protein PoB_000809300 [Plakobranchus ocellatus]